MRNFLRKSSHPPFYVIEVFIFYMAGISFSCITSSKGWERSEMCLPVLCNNVQLLHQPIFNLLHPQLQSIPQLCSTNQGFQNQLAFRSLWKITIQCPFFLQFSKPFVNFVNFASRPTMLYEPYLYKLIESETIGQFSCAYNIYIAMAKLSPCVTPSSERI